MKNNSMTVNGYWGKGNHSGCSLNGTDDSTDEMTFAVYTFIINVIIAGTLVLGGIFFNTLCVLTLQRDRRKLSMTILLQGLAISDSVFLVYTFLYTVLRTCFTFSENGDIYESISPYIVAYVLPFGWISQTTSIWIVLLVSLDRYVAICHPFSAHEWCTVRNARIGVCLTYLVSVVFNSPRFFYYYHVAFEVPDVPSNCTPGGSTMVAHGDVGDPFWHRFRLVYHVGLTITVLFVIPLPLLIGLNLKLIREISAARNRQRHLGGTSKIEKDSITVTMNLVVVVTVFLICQAPDFITAIIKSDGIKHLMNKTALNYFLCVKELLLVLGASTNFVIYCLFYEKFRRLLHGLLCPGPVEDSDIYSEADRGGPAEGQERIASHKVAAAVEKDAGQVGGEELVNGKKTTAVT